jgi:hypothetical protein
MPSLVTNHSPPCAIGELVEGSVVLDTFDDKPGRGACSEANFVELRKGEVRRIPLPKLFGKASGVGR